MDNNEGIALASGGFDPLHSGHLAMLEDAACGNERLIVALNSDEWLTRKKGSYFLPFNEREIIMSSLEGVSKVISFNDDDGSACDAIAKVKQMYPDSTVNFYNGGDRNEGNILEILKYSDDPQVQFHYGTGGAEKQNSSSTLLEDWLSRHQQTTPRNWGVYNVLAEYPGAKVKTLHVAPGESLSTQYHEHRNEHWFVVEGTASVTMGLPGEFGWQEELGKHEIITIEQGQWHTLSNNTNTDLCLVEIQYGEKCQESDIVRQSR